jgi:hypothetical protein
MFCTRIMVETNTRGVSTKKYDYVIGGVLASMPAKGKKSKQNCQEADDVSLRYCWK